MLQLKTGLGQFRGRVKMENPIGTAVTHSAGPGKYFQCFFGAVHLEGADDFFGVIGACGKAEFELPALLAVTVEQVEIIGGLVGTRHT